MILVDVSDVIDTEEFAVGLPVRKRADYVAELMRCVATQVGLWHKTRKMYLATGKVGEVDVLLIKHDRKSGLSDLETDELLCLDAQASKAWSAYVEAMKRRDAAARRVGLDYNAIQALRKGKS